MSGFLCALSLVLQYLAVPNDYVFVEDTVSVGFVNHASGHRPPSEALDKGYDFMTGILF